MARSASPFRHPRLVRQAHIDRRATFKALFASPPRQYDMVSYGEVLVTSFFMTHMIIRDYSDSFIGCGETTTTMVARSTVPREDRGSFIGFPINL